MINLWSFGDNLLSALGYLGGRLVTNRWVGDHLVTTEGSLGCHLDGDCIVTTLGSVWDPLVITFWVFCEIQTLIEPKQKTYCASNHDHFKKLLKCTAKWTFTFTTARLIDSWLQIDTSFSIWFGMWDMSKKIARGGWSGFKKALTWDPSQTFFYVLGCIPK